MESLSDVDQAILTAAEKEFSLHGFHDTVVKDIASRAGVGKGTVYRHFGNKHELFGSLIEHSTRELRCRLEKILDKDCLVENLLKAITDLHFEFFDTKRPIVEIIVKEGLERTGEEMDVVIEEWTQYRSLIEGVFCRGIDEHSDWSLKDPEVASRLYISWIWGFFRDSVVFELEADPDVYRDTLHAIFAGGMKHCDT